MLKKTRMINLFIFILSLTIVVIVLELTVRCFGFAPSYFFKPGIFVNNKKYEYSLKPNYIGKQGHLDIRTNKYGWRDDFNKIFDDQKIRILLLGDSCTFGFGVDFQDIYAEQLELLLEAHYDEPVEVYNTGVMGFSTVNEYKVAKDLIPSIKPQLTILQMTNNDYVYPEWSVRSDGNLRRIQEEKYKEDNTLYAKVSYYVKKSLCSNSTFFRHTVQRFRRLKLGKQSEKILVKYENASVENEWVTCFKYIKKIVSLSEKNHSKFLVVLIHHNEIVENYLTKHNINYIKPLPLYDETLILKNDPHHNKFGHKLVAERLFDNIMNKKLLKDQ